MLMRSALRLRDLVFFNHKRRQPKRHLFALCPIRKLATTIEGHAMNRLMDNIDAPPIPPSPRTRAYEEKRDFIRMRVVIPAHIKDAHGETQIGKCHNLSGGGALLEFTKGYSVNEHVQLTIESHHGHAPMLVTMGKVVRAEPSMRGDTMFVAIAYLK